MKKLILSLVGATALFSTQASAFDACCWDPCGCFEVGAAAVWWKACQCPFEYGTLSDTLSNDSRIERLLSVKPSLEWGFRVWVGYYSDNACWFTTLGWTYVKPSDFTKVAANGSTLTIFTPESQTQTTDNADYATAKIRSRYNKVNWRLGYYLHRGCDIDFYSFAGLRYVSIHHTQKVTYHNSSGDGNRKTKAKWDGAALEFGAGMEYHVGCGFNLAGYFGGLAALGEQKLHSVYNAPANQTSHTGGVLKYNTFTSCLPGVEARIGINYTYDCGCGALVGEIGYEIDYYFNILSFQHSYDRLSSCENFGFAGPYASLSFCF